MLSIFSYHDVSYKINSLIHFLPVPIMPNIYLFYIFLTALFTVLVLVPPISRLAVSIGIFDGQDERKLHSGAIPRLGGIAVFFAVLLSTILFSDIDRQIRGFLAGGVVIFLTGLTDDLTGLVARKKLLGQFVAALIATVVGDLSLTSLGDLFGTGQIELGYISVPFTVFAIVGVINAINLMDGLDGLAGGVTAIAASALGIIAYSTGNQHLVGICVALLGGVIGFLKFNSYPAKIFMGDGGSLFLGYCLAIFAIHLVEHEGGHVSAMVPVIILAVPICDTCFVMMRRIWKRQPISTPDRSHIHHRFMDLGIGHKATVILVYGLSYCLAIYAVMFQKLPDYRHIINLVLMLVGFYGISRVLSMLQNHDANRISEDEESFLTVFHYRLLIGSYGFRRFFSVLLNRHADHFIKDDESFLNVFTYRWMVHYSHYLLLVVKYLVLVILFLSFFITSRPSYELASVAGLLIILTIILIFQTNDWSNRFLQFVLYFNAAFLVYVVENYGRATLIAGVELRMVSMYVFAALFFLSGTLLFIRKKSRHLMNSPLEYFILFIVISIPLLPSSFSGPQHLLTVAGKSLILFLSYKLIFMLNVRRNRKVIIATLLALFACGVRSLL